LNSSTSSENNSILNPSIDLDLNLNPYSNTELIIHSSTKSKFNNNIGKSLRSSVSNEELTFDTKKKLNFNDDNFEIHDSESETYSDLESDMGSSSDLNSDSEHIPRKGLRGRKKKKRLPTQSLSCLSLVKKRVKKPTLKQEMFQMDKMKTRNQKKVKAKVKETTLSPAPLH
jgi:hypothetical protein